ncbi:MAG: hypothetical protein WA751_03260 [Candidatus Dormiibacterota bacterium]
MARRTRRRPTSNSRKRPPKPPVRPTVAEVAPVEAEAEIADEVASSPPEPAATPAPSSFLPRRQSGSVPTQVTSPAPPTPVARPTSPVAQPPSAATSYLPRKGNIVGRAERQRQQQANLEPLDDSPAVPTDRTPYLWLDLRRVIGVSVVMIVMVIVGAFVIH